MEEQDQYSSFPIAKIYPEHKLPADLYVFVGGKFIKYKNEGDEVDFDRYNHFIYKKIQFLFVHSDDIEAYRAWSQEIQDELKADQLAMIGLEFEDIVDTTNEIKDEFLNFITGSISDETVSSIVEKTKSLAKSVLARQNISKIVTKMQSTNGTIADHATNVANLAVFIGVNIGYSHQRLLENLYLGGLFHDYGKLKIDPKLFDEPDSEEYKEMIKKHPTLGKTSLLTETSLGDEILSIVSQHHEHHDGSGYPKGIRGSRIYELTKIVSIANVFDNIVAKCDGSLSERQAKALDLIEGDDGRRFDPKVLAKAVKCLRLVI